MKMNENQIFNQWVSWEEGTVVYGGNELFEIVQYARKLILNGVIKVKTNFGTSSDSSA